MFAGFFLIAIIYIISTGDSAPEPIALKSRESRIMKKKIMVYWPLALIVPLAAIAWVHAWNTTQEQLPLAADQVSAELARAVSYGLVGSAGEVKTPVKAPLKATRGVVPLPQTSAI